MATEETGGYDDDRMGTNASALIPWEYGGEDWKGWIIMLGKRQRI